MKMWDNFFSDQFSNFFFKLNFKEKNELLGGYKNFNCI